MPSPFPGMDPYLEGYLWPDVHHSLATQIREQLTPYLRPRYVARIEIQVVVDDVPQSEIGIIYPDVEIVRSRQRQPERVTPLRAAPPAHSGVLLAEELITPASVTVRLPEIEVRLATVEIYDTAQNQLVTSIEILSPVNKHEPGLTKYRAKWRQLRAAQVHLIEIDLLRRGQRPLLHPQIPDSRYRISLLRAGSTLVDTWALNLPDPLPIIPVPLHSPDADIALDLGLALRTIYERAAYDLSIDYRAAPPPPALTDAESEWLQRQFM